MASIYAAFADALYKAARARAASDDEAYDEGWNARQSGKPRQENPYFSDETGMREAWDEGWDDAEYYNADDMEPRRGQRGRDTIRRRREGR